MANILHHSISHLLYLNAIITEPLLRMLTGVENDLLIAQRMPQINQRTMRFISTNQRPIDRTVTARQLQSQAHISESFMGP